MRVTQSGEVEGCWETEPHSETKCEKGNPKRKRMVVEFSMRGKQMSSWAWGNRLGGESGAQLSEELLVYPTAGMPIS